MHESTSHESTALDPVVISVVDLIAADFPGISVDAVEAHITLLRAAAVYSATLGKIYGELGLSTSRFNLLWLLYRTEGKRLSLGALADHMGITLPSVTKSVNTLVADGWIYTEKGVTDRRVTFVELRDEGDARFENLLGEVLQVWRDVWSDLPSDEIKEMVTSLSRLRVSLLSRYLGVSGLAAFRARQHHNKSTGQLFAQEENGDLEHA